jgi:hypothetical protein
MKKIILLLVVLLSFSGCSLYPVYEIYYAVYGTATTATIRYIDNTGANIEEEITLPWYKEYFITDGNPVGISAKNTSNGEIDVRLYFDKRGYWQPYERKISNSSVSISGVIY